MDSSSEDSSRKIYVTKGYIDDEHPQGVDLLLR